MAIAPRPRLNPRRGAFAAGAGAGSLRSAALSEGGRSSRPGLVRGNLKSLPSWLRAARTRSSARRASSAVRTCGPRRSDARGLGSGSDTARFLREGASKVLRVRRAPGKVFRARVVITFVDLWLIDL